MIEPTDKQLEDFAVEEQFLLFCDVDEFTQIARAVLAKWGTLRAEKIVLPTDTMEQEFQKHYQRGYAAGQKASASQPTQAQAGAVPLTDDQRCRIVLTAYTVGEAIDMVERHHGIKGGQHGTS